MSDLAAVSPLGTPRAQMDKLLHEGAGVRISEAPFTRVVSVRQSRKSPDTRAAQDYVKTLGGQALHLEPRAWLVLSEQLLADAQPPPDLMVTDLSDRFALFRIGGPGALDVIASGCDPTLVPVGAGIRTRFGAMANVVIERRSENDCRLAVDVSIAGAMASWLVQAAA